MCLTINTKQMKCKTLHSKLIFFLEKELEQAEMQAIQEHLNSCTDCAHFAEEMKKTLGVIESDKVTEVNPFFYTRVKARLENQTVQQTVAAQSILIRILQPVAFSIILLFGIYAGIKVGDTSVKTNGNETLVLQDDLIPYWNELDSEPIETFLME